MNYLYVGATPGTNSDALRVVEDCLFDTFGVPVRKIELPETDFAFDAKRRQYASTALLEMLARLRPRDARKLIGITEGDLYIPVLTFVFGHAQLGGRTALVSLARLRQEFYGLEPNREIFLERVRKEALHEAGHLFGLVHCTDPDCAMSLSTGVQQIDRKRAAYCASCAALLRKRGTT
jgi:archaemetzincin